MKIYVVLLSLRIGHNRLLTYVKCHPLHVPTASCAKTQLLQWAETAYCNMNASPKSLSTGNNN